jgi:hypothetical protein
MCKCENNNAIQRELETITRMMTVSPPVRINTCHRSRTAHINREYKKQQQVSGSLAVCEDDNRRW